MSAPTLTLDFDDDGNVDVQDLAQWRGEVAINEPRDSDGDDDSDGADFLAWQRQAGSDVSTVTASAIAPERNSALVILSFLEAVVRWSAGCGSDGKGTVLIRSTALAREL